MFSTLSIRTVCAEKGIKIAQLERDIGLPNGMIGKMETAKGTPQLHVLVAIADYLNVPFEKIAFNREPQTDTQLNAIQNQLVQLIPLLDDADISVLLATAQSLIASRKFRDIDK